MPSYQRPTRHSARSVNKRTHANRFAQNTPQLMVWESLGIKTSGQRAALPKSRFSSFYTQERKHQRVSDYRSINLTHSCSKIISKVLANRLDAELEHLILVNQSVFLKKRWVHNNFVYVQEILSTCIRKKFLPKLHMFLTLSTSHTSLASCTCKCVKERRKGETHAHACSPRRVGHGVARRWTWAHDMRVNSLLKSGLKPRMSATSFCCLVLLRVHV
jgi:hypothetical protein